MTPHNEAEIGDFAKTVIMPGDPLRAKYIAENFLEDAKLVNSVRNMLAYTGLYKEKEFLLWHMVWVCQVLEFIHMNYINFMM